MAFNQKRKKHSVQYAQNFLQNPRLVRQLLKKAKISPKDIVLEIGPGRGVITKELARQCKKVVAVEKDRSLAADLKKSLSELNNVAIIREDFLTFKIHHQDFKIFANPPFVISSKIIRKLVQLPNPPRDTFLIMQREAAVRFSSLNKEYLFAVQNRPWFRLRIIHHFKPSDFRPSPGVDTVLLQMQQLSRPGLPFSERKAFKSFVAAGVTGKHTTLRKNIQGAISPKQWRQFTKEHGLEGDVTPLALPPTTWVALFKLSKNLHPGDH